MALDFCHIKVSIGSKLTASAVKKVDYITRSGDYRKDRKEVLATDSGNMPSWSQNDSYIFWKSLDDHERSNGRLYRTIEFSLPNETSLDKDKSIIYDIVESICGEEHPYTYAIHSGKGTNKHCHLILSERINDGIDRTPETWFKRAHPSCPEKGGARKSQEMNGKEWLFFIREEYATIMNKHLIDIGQDPLVDHRSYKDQGIEQIPTVHTGYGIKSDLLKENNVEIRQINTQNSIDNHQLEQYEIELEQYKKILLEQQIEKKQQEQYFTLVGIDGDKALLKIGDETMKFPATPDQIEQLYMIKIGAIVELKDDQSFVEYDADQRRQEQYLRLAGIEGDKVILKKGDEIIEQSVTPEQIEQLYMIKIGAPINFKPDGSIEVIQESRKRSRHR